MADLPERDWKVLRELAPRALERFCRRALQDVSALVEPAGEDAADSHQRYLQLCKLMAERDEQLAFTFNDLRRSNAIMRLTAMRQCEAITDEEFQRFTPETRQRVGVLTEFG